MFRIRPAALRAVPLHPVPRAVHRLLPAVALAAAALLGGCVAYPAGPYGYGYAPSYGYPAYGYPAYGYPAGGVAIVGGGWGWHNGWHDGWHDGWHGGWHH